MGHLFLDIETYTARKKQSSALNPYLPDSKVLLIAYSYYETFRPPVKDEIKSPIFLIEWEKGEKAMLSNFLSFLRVIEKKDPNLRIHGFNILKFDLPYLFGRMKVHRLAESKELHAILFGHVGTDMMQLGSLVSNKTRAKEQIWDISQHDVNNFFGIQIKEGTHKECSRYYDSKKFDAIINQCRQEFIFEQLMNAFYLYVQNLMNGKEHGVDSFFKKS